jgi:hypothetical protein
VSEVIAGVVGGIIGVAIAWTSCQYIWFRITGGKMGPMP